MSRLPLEHRNVDLGHDELTNTHTPGSALEASRAEAIRRLEAFLPNAGGRYAKTRNYDYGPANRANVSNLSPFVRHRLVSEREIVEAVLQRHALSTAEKFIQEVCWRTYWKGWLQQRPTVWADYLTERDAQLAVLSRDGRLARDWKNATSGTTGIECFDFWARELVETGYLHNHARMWFASIWVFTLKLPWSLGADFFYRHLLDGDPASNTLSWRWVAGRQTIGKTYQARESNIAKFTDGRFPETPGLADMAAPPSDPPEHPVRQPISPPRTGAAFKASDSKGSVILLLHEDDLTPEQWPVPTSAVAGAILLEAEHGHHEVADNVRDFRKAAGQDALQRAEQHFRVRTRSVRASSKVAETHRAIEGAVADLTADADKDGALLSLVTIEPPVGPTRTLLNEIWSGHTTGSNDDASGKVVRPTELRREWDTAFWPHATAGFFKLKKKIPDVLRDLGIT